MFYLLICVSGLGSVAHGYHCPATPTPFHTPTVPSLSSEMGHNHANEMSPTSDLTSMPNDSQIVSEITNTSKRTTENDPMDNIKKNVTTTTPHPTTRRQSLGDKFGFRNYPLRSKPVPKLGELFVPSLEWHVGIYSKTFTPYMQVCGGSLVRPDVVLSAAHCFWDDEIGKLREDLFAVAAGKLLRPWETKEEMYKQHSEIKEIKIPPRFQGAKTSFQDDIAIVFLSSPLEYAPGVKPICLSFDQETERRLLKSGNLGTIAGWGLTMPNGPPSQRLNYVKLPYVDIQDCIRNAEPSFLKYITSDKICAGDNVTGRALCKGDSGGALTYYADKVPYLVGIASVALRDKHECNAYAVGTFTYARAHSVFLQEHVPMIGEGCEGLYSNATAVQNETIAGVTQSPTTGEIKAQKPQLKVAARARYVLRPVTEKTSNIVTYNGGIMEPVTTDQNMIETMGVTQDEQLLMQELGITLPDTAVDQTSSNVKEPVTGQKMVIMSVESGEQSVVRVPVEGASLVFNCYCKD